MHLMLELICVLEYKNHTIYQREIVRVIFILYLAVGASTIIERQIKRSYLTIMHGSAVLLEDDEPELSSDVTLTTISTSVSVLQGRRDVHVVWSLACVS